MIAALVQGTLASDPQERTSANGNPFWTCNIRVPAGGEVLFIGLATFDPDAGARLAKLRKGGTLEATAWTGKDGEERRGWRLTANEVLSVYQATKKRRDSEGTIDA